MTLVGKELMVWKERSGSKLFDTQMVLLKDFFEKDDFEKKSADDIKARKFFPGVKVNNCSEKV